MSSRYDPAGWAEEERQWARLNDAMGRPLPIIPCVVGDGSGNVYPDETWDFVLVRPHDATGRTVIAQTRRHDLVEGQIVNCQFQADRGPALMKVLGRPRINACPTYGQVYLAAGAPSGGSTTEGVNAIDYNLDNLVWDVAPHPTVAGEFYIAATGDLKVFKVAADGTITTFAGNGTGSFEIDGLGGAATSATISTVRGVCCDAAGVVYLTTESFTPANYILKVEGGIISAITGPIDFSVFCPRLHPLTGDLYYCEVTGNKRIMRLPMPLDGTTTPVVVCTFSDDVYALGFDGTGTLYASTLLTLWRVDGGTPVALHTFASTFAGIAVDRCGVVYMALEGDDRIDMYRDGVVTPLTPNDSSFLAPLPSPQPLVTAFIDGPIGMSFDGQDNLYVASNGAGVVRMIGP